MLIRYKTDDNRMHPNDNYYGLYRKEYLEAGLYALTAGVAGKTGIYEDLVSSFGEQDAHLLLDAAMFVIS